MMQITKLPRLERWGWRCSARLPAVGELVLFMPRPELLPQQYRPKPRRAFLFEGSEDQPPFFTGCWLGEERGWIDEDGNRYTEALHWGELLPGIQESAA